jgi:hypothetical protein
MRWTFLEVMLDQLILALLSIDSDDTGVSLTSNIDFREKIQIALAVGLKKKLDEVWYDKLKELLDQIDNDLRLQRNRYVHDLWTLSGTQIKKLQFKTSIKRPQARMPLELKTQHETIVSPEEIWSLAEKINLAAGHVALSAQAYQIYTRRASRKK